MRPRIASSQPVAPVVRHPEANGAFVLVGRSLVDEPRRELAAAVHRVELERDGAVPVDPEPRERSLDLLDRLRDLAARVGVLDPEQALALATAREQPVEEKRVRRSDVEEARRRRRHADADAHCEAIVVRRRRRPVAQMAAGSPTRTAERGSRPTRPTSRRPRSRESSRSRSRRRQGRRSPRRRG